MHRIPMLRAVALWITVAARMGEQWLERTRGVDFIQYTMDEARRHGYEQWSRSRLA